jgi:hypothetical protein
MQTYCVSHTIAANLKVPLKSSCTNQKKIIYRKNLAPTQFVSTDVIPILIRTWPSALGNQGLAKKALLDRVWLVINYMLLDDKHLFANGTNNQLNDITDINLDLSTINTSRSGFSFTLDKIIND